MGEILGLGMTLQDPGLPERYRDPASWPARMRGEYGDDGGTGSAAAHRDSLLRQFRQARKALDDFAPDVVIIWGDDQYENFTEDIDPPFCILAYDEVEARPWEQTGRTPNAWGEGRTRCSGSKATERRGSTWPRVSSRPAWTWRMPTGRFTIRGLPTPSSTRSCSSTTTAPASTTR